MSTRKKTPPAPTASESSLFGEPCKPWECTHEPRRDDRWGRPIVGGSWMTRASTVAKTLGDTHNLIDWRARLTLAGATPALIARAKKARAADDKKGWNEAATVAADRAGASEARELGTHLHELLAHWNSTGAMPDDAEMSDSERQSINAYRAKIETLGLHPFCSEVFVADADREVAGTFDVGLIDKAGDRWLADIKTGPNEWERTYTDATAVQLMAYAMGRPWCAEAGAYLAEEPEWAGILLISVPQDAGRCTISELDAERGLAGLELALQVRQYRRTEPRAVAFTQDTE